MGGWRDVSEDRSEEKLDNREHDMENDAGSDHFKSTYELKSCAEYEVNDYRYETDSKGRISHCEGRLRLEEGKTNTAHQRKAGGEDRLETDDGGHLIARRFGGSEKVDNIVPMDRTLNRGEYKAMENDWAKYVEDGKTVDVKINCKYDDPQSNRPSEFRVRYVVSDESGEIERKSKKFYNSKEG